MLVGTQWSEEWLAGIVSGRGEICVSVSFAVSV